MCWTNRAESFLVHYITADIGVAGLEGVLGDRR